MSDGRPSPHVAGADRSSAGRAALMRPLRTLAPRLEALLLERRLLHGAAWLFAGAFMARVTALVASLLVARALGLPSFGKFGMLQSTLLMFQTFAAFGL